MAERLYVGTRKGLFEVVRRKAGWDIAAVHFLGDPVSAVLADGDNLYAGLDLGHFGAKLWRREGDSGWREVAAPAFPSKPTDATDDRTRGRSVRSGQSNRAACRAGCGSARCPAGCSAPTMAATAGP